jgi:uncharacterized protein Veg
MISVGTEELGIEIEITLNGGYKQTVRHFKVLEKLRSFLNSLNGLMRRCN